MNEALRVLLVDDEESFLRPMGGRLAALGMHVETAKSGPEALEVAEAAGGGIDVAVIDQTMGPPNGTDIMLRLRERYPGIEALILTAWGDLKPGERAMELGAFRYMSKPITAEELALNIRVAARFGRERARKASLEALVQAGQRISGANDEDSLYERLCEAATGLLPTLDTFLVSRWDEPSQTVSFPFCYHRGERTARAGRSGHKGITEYVIQAKQPLLLVNGDETFRKEHGLQPPEIAGCCVSEIVVPMFLDGQVLGTLSVLSYQEGVHYTPEHLQVFQAFANQAALAIQNLHKIREAHLLKDAVAALAAQAGTETILQTVVEQAHRLIDSDFTGLILHDPNGQLRKVQPVIPRDYFDRFGDPRQEGGVTRWVVDNASPRMISDTMADPLVKDSVRDVGIRSMLAMPLVSGQRVWGALYAHTFRQRQFSDHEVNLWSAFAAQAAAAIHNLWRSQQSQIWKSMAQKADVCTDLRGLYRLFAEYALLAFGADLAVFYPYDPTVTPEQLIVEDIQVVGNLRGEWRAPAGGLGAGVYSAVDRAEEGVLIVNDLTAESGRWDSHLAEREGVKAFVAVRVDIVTEGSVRPRRAGMLFVNFRHRTAFAAADLTDVRAAANHVAATVLRLQALALAERERMRVAEQMAAVLEILKASRARGPMENLLTSIAVQVQKVFGVDICSVLEYDSDRGLFWVRGVAGTADQQFTPEDTQKFRDFLSQADPVAVADAPGHPVFGRSGFVARHGIKSLVVYPLRCAGEPVGLLFENYVKRRAFEPSHIQAVAPFADLAAIVMTEAKLREQLEATRKRLDRRIFLDWVSMIEASWRHSLVIKASAIRNHAALVQKRLATCSAPVPIHDEMRAAVAAIDGLTEGIANAPPRVPQSWEMQAEWFPLAPLLVEVAERESSPVVANTRMKIGADVAALGDAQVYGYRRWVVHALELLLQNARNAMPKGGLVTIQGRREGEWAEIRIRDAGGGIPEAIRARLFREPVPKEEDPTGMGLGCVLAATVVEDHGGTIECEETGSEGTTILVRLPVSGGAR